MKAKIVTRSVLETVCLDLGEPKSIIIGLIQYQECALNMETSEWFVDTVNDVNPERENWCTEQYIELLEKAFPERKFA